MTASDFLIPSSVIPYGLFFPWPSYKDPVVSLSFSRRQQQQQQQVYKTTAFWKAAVPTHDDVLGSSHTFSTRFLPSFVPSFVP